MGKSFYLSILAWFGGTTLCIILTAIVFKIGWESKERVLLWGFGGLGSITVFVFTLAKQINAAQVKELEDKIAKKADESAIKNLQTQIDNVHGIMSIMRESQVEEREMIQKIYDHVLYKN